MTFQPVEKTGSLAFLTVSGNAVAANCGLKAKQYFLENTSLKSNETTLFAEHADLTQPQYLIASNCNEIPVIDSLKIYSVYDCANGSSVEMFIGFYPSWLINHLLGCLGKKWFELADKQWVLSLDFLPEYLPKCKIKVKCKKNFDFTLVSRCTLLGYEERDELFKGMKNFLYQTQLSHVKGNELSQILGFHLITNSIVINNKHVNDIVEIKVMTNEYPNHLLLHYNATLIALYAKKTTNSIEVFYNHENSNSFDHGYVHSRLGDAKVFVKWRDGVTLDESVNFAAKTLNLFRPGGWIFTINNFGKIRNPVESHFSFHSKKLPSGVVVNYEGLWWEGTMQDTKYPIPLPALEKVEQKYINVLEQLWEAGKNDGEYRGITVLIEQYLGMSKCRCCQQSNGSSEMWMTDHSGKRFVVPQGFVHYLDQHNIQMSPQLKAFIDENCFQIF